MWPQIVAVVSSTERGGEENLGNETATREVDKEGATNGGRGERGSTEKRRRSDEIRIVRVSLGGLAQETCFGFV